MLHFLAGPAGSGKTHRVDDSIEEETRAGRKSILLVPEQLSFESEKRLSRSLGQSLSLSVEVLSFTRLCNYVFRRLGGLAERAVTPAARYLLMSLAVEEMRDNLEVYRKNLSNTAFLQTLVDTCSEFKTAGVTPEKLSEAAEGCGGNLGKKLRELSGIYGVYQAMIERGYSDGDDDLIRACALLENNNLFEEHAVFVDGFTTFMAAEFELLGHLIAQSREITFAMTCDSAEDRQQGMGVFSSVQGAIRRLTRLAEEKGVDVAPVEEFSHLLRYMAPALAHISQFFLQPAPTPCPEEPGDTVRCHAARDRYGEIEYVAAAIRKKVGEEGLRYNQIAVVARDTGPYLRALEAVFQRYEIPYFTDEPRDIENHPLVSTILHAVDTVRANFDSEAVLLLAKSPLTGFDVEAVSQLENYVYCWGIRGAAWQEPFTANPRGMAGKLTEEDGARLAGLNEIRTALMEPLLALKESLSAGDGRQFAAGVYGYLEAIGAAEHLTAYGESLSQEMQVDFLNESAQVWDAVVEILDIFGGVLGAVRMKRARLCELLRLALCSAEVGLPPQTLDQVLVGKADRIRPVNIRCAFVIGAVEGEFPAQVGPVGVFTDTERKRMLELGVELAAPTLQRSVLERFFAYYAVTIAADSLTVTYPKSGLEGQELLPSVIVAQLKALFPELPLHRWEQEDYLAGEKTVLEAFARDFGQIGPWRETLAAFLRENGRENTVERMEVARSRPVHRLSERGTARGLFGTRMRLSPTRVERYFRCPFSYFAADGLRLRTRNKVEFTPLEAGSVIHNVLQVMVQRHGGKGLLALPIPQLEEEVSVVIRDYLAEKVEDPEKLPVRFRHQFERLAGMLARLLHRLGLEFDQSEFDPMAFELPISSEKEGVEPLLLETADGIRVQVEGVVDRVDIMEKGGKKYVRVVDYKSGAKQFSLHDILYGINMQMLLYLFTIAENGTGDLADSIPAGVLYMPVREKYVSGDRHAGDESIAAEHRKSWRMSGLLLEDEEVLRGMERDLAGVFIPAKMSKKGLDAKASLAGRAELGALARKVKDQIRLMAKSLSEGQIGARPAVSQDFDTCAYCDYRAVCGYEPGDPIREIAKIDQAEVLKLLREEEDDNGGA